MRIHTKAIPFGRPSLCFFLFCALLAVLWIAGGASRADAVGQIIVRAFAVLALMLTILFAPRPKLGQSLPIACLLGGAVVLVALQLVPLPPYLWQALPGRATFVQAGELAVGAQPFRPLAIVPGAAVNALTSLLVPIAAYAILIGLTDRQLKTAATLVLGVIALSTFIGLLQFSGIRFDNPFVNETVGDVSGTFANRNHFGLLLAFGCLLAPAWAFAATGDPGWRAIVVVGLIALFIATILASGSRAGILVGAVALALGLVIVQQRIRELMSRYPVWVFATLVAVAIALLGLLVIVSVAADRAVSIDRLLTSDVGSDMRSRGLPTVTAMITAYFPAGIGFGGFSSLFFVHEPFELLKPTYFNHAHNDWLQIPLEGGLPGALLLMAGVAWWAWHSFHAWFRVEQGQSTLPQIGSAFLLLVFIASAFDYPARTPIIMALTVLAAIWLSKARPTT